MDKTLLFIVNPRAGKTKSSAPLFDAVATFGRAGYLVRVMLTQAAGDATRFAAQWGGDYDLVVCAGGDGTLNETLSGLMQLENRPPVGYLPNGSTNDFAASLRIPSSVQQAARAVVEGTPIPWIWGPTTTGISPMWPPSGPLPRRPTPRPRRRRTPWATLRTFWRASRIWTPCGPTAARWRPTASPSTGTSSSARCATPPPWGGLVKLDPKWVHMDDGMFELILLRMPKTALDLQNLITALNRMDYDYPGVIFRHVRSVTVTTREDIPWSLDGEYAPSAPRVEIRNLHSAVQLMIRDDE